MHKCPNDGQELEDMGIPGSPGCFEPCKKCGAEWYYTQLQKEPARTRESVGS